MSLDADLEDDVFISPRTDSGNDPFSTRNLEIFGLGSPRTPAGILLSPRRERTFTFSVTSEKHWRDKGGTANNNAEENDADVTDAASPEETASASDKDDDIPETESSIFSSIIPDKVSGSICTAILLMLGWKLLSHTR